mmetsp:Transcript_4483/g.13423  ORF Transcript_4483/g.13423 Transcript_4483/m.13423 type:complete len:983 (+) Transcript_4483:140-3088(+)
MKELDEIALNKLLQLHCKWRCMNPGNSLHPSRQTRVAGAPWSDYSPKLQGTISKYLRKKWLQTTVLVWTTVQFYFLVSFSLAIKDYGEVPANLVSLKLKDNGLAMQNTNLGNVVVSVLSGGCRVLSTAANVRDIENNVLNLTNLPRTFFDGFSVERIGGNDSNPLLVVIQGLHAGSGSWENLTSARIRLVESGVRLTEETFTEVYPNSQATFDLRPPWTLMFGSLWMRGASSVLVLLVLSLSALTRTDLPQVAAAFGAGVMSANFLVLTISYSVYGAYDELLWTGGMAIILACLGIVFFVAPGQATISFVAASAVSIALSLASECGVMRDCGRAAEALDYGASSALPLAAGLAVLAHQWMVGLVALRAVFPDAQRNERTWRRTICSQDDRENMAALHILATELSTKCPSLAGPVRHLHETVGDLLIPTSRLKFWVRIAGRFIGDRALSETVRMAPTTCLNQIYSQALVASLLLRRIARDWRPASDPEKGDQAREMSTVIEQLSQGLKDSRCAFQHGIMRLVRRGWLKDPRRAAEKALACYGGDVSRVVDVARLRVWMENAEEAIAYLRAVEGDGRVAVVRVKSWVDPSQTSWGTAGFRGIVLNLRLNGERVKSMGLSGHVCEVQFLFTPFQCVEDPDVHRRFLSFHEARTQAGIAMLLRLAHRSELLAAMHFYRPRESSFVDELSLDARPETQARNALQRVQVEPGDQFSVDSESVSVSRVPSEGSMQSNFRHPVVRSDLAYPAGVSWRSPPVCEIGGDRLVAENRDERAGVANAVSTAIEIPRLCSIAIVSLDEDAGPVCRCAEPSLVPVASADRELPVTHLAKDHSGQGKCVNIEFNDLHSNVTEVQDGQDEEHCPTSNPIELLYQRSDQISESTRISISWFSGAAFSRGHTTPSQRALPIFSAAAVFYSQGLPVGDPPPGKLNLLTLQQANHCWREASFLSSRRIWRWGILCVHYDSPVYEGGQWGQVRLPFFAGFISD